MTLKTRTFWVLLWGWVSSWKGDEEFGLGARSESACCLSEAVRNSLHLQQRSMTRGAHPKVVQQHLLNQVRWCTNVALSRNKPNLGQQTAKTIGKVSSHLLADSCVGMSPDTGWRHDKGWTNAVATYRSVLVDAFVDTSMLNCYPRAMQRMQRGWGEMSFLVSLFTLNYLGVFRDWTQKKLIR